MEKNELENLSAPSRIRLAARRLFAERGVDGVTTREIIAAAGLNIQGSLNYYFRTKEALVRDLVVGGAKKIDDRRNAWLDALEAKGGPTEIRELTDILVFGSVRISRGGKYREDSYIRFITLLSLSHRELFEDALQNQWNKGYQRCLEHIRKLMPDMPIEIKNQRLLFAGGYLGIVLSMREQALSKQLNPQSIWANDETLHHFSYTLASMLMAPHNNCNAGSSQFI